MIANLLEKITKLKEEIVRLEAEIEKYEENKSTNKRWRAEDDCTYWFVGANGKLSWSYEYNRESDDFRYDTHNYFKSENDAEAQRYAKVLETERQLKRFADEHNGKIDWIDINRKNCSLCYNYIRCEVVIIRSCMIKDARVIYFSSEEIARQALDEIGEEKIKEYLTYEW